MLGVLIWRYGRVGLDQLATFQLRGGLAAVLALMAQIVSMWTQQHRFEWLAVSILFLAWFGWLNRRHLGIVLASVGIALNMIVMLANGGVMPVSPESISRVADAYVEPGTPLSFSKSNVQTAEQTTFAWLSDRLHLPGPLGQLAAWSIGDILLLAGIWHLLWSVMKGQVDYARVISEDVAAVS